jgi:hypothetical protein
MSAPDLLTLTRVTLWAATFCQIVVLWLQLRAFAHYKHRSFAILAVGTLLGLVSSAISAGLSVSPSDSPAIRSLYGAALIGTIAQIPLAIWGVIWLFRSYGHLQLRSQQVLPNTSLERAREG